MRSRMWSLAVASMLAACSGGGGGGGPVGNGGPPAVAGTYNATFTATQATGCQDFVTTGSSTTGSMTVSQSGSTVTLQIAGLHPVIASNPVGTISDTGVYHFGPGSVLIDGDPADPNSQLFMAMGTFDGSFSGNSMNIGFNFTLATCNVVGTITGTRS